MDMKKLKAEGKRLDPLIRIGKSGLTKNVILEMRKHLKKRGIIKVKLLRSFLEGRPKKEAFSDIVSLTEAVPVDTIGFTMVLARKGYNPGDVLQEKED